MQIWIPCSRHLSHTRWLQANQPNKQIVLKWKKTLTSRKYSTNLGSWKTIDLYSSVATTAMSSINARHSGFGETGGCMPCSSVAAVKRCSVLKQRCSSPNECSITSPCTVTRSEPWMVSGGWERMAKWVGPPPLPTVPPRPWNMVSFTPNFWATFTRSSWDLYICHAAERRPASLPESEYLKFPLNLS